MRSAGQDTPDPDADLEDVPDRGEVLDLIDDALREAHRKVESGRVYDAENEKVRQGWFRTLGYLAGQYRQLKKDEDLEELRERIDRLESERGVVRDR